MLTPAQRRFYAYGFAAAAVYNVLWGAAIVLFPLVPFRWAGLAAPDAIGVQLWQCIGMFVLVWGVGYAYLAADPERYAPIALVGLLGKLFGPIGWVWGYAHGDLPAVTGFTCLTNDLLWWPVFVPFVWQTLIRPPLRRRAAARARGRLQPVSP